ncbi:hypothetical protein PENSTE_c005G04893 [Penicillium steckii]|uniref:Glycosyl hydrolase family 13 catalytic domain-containing protein n=1 Tax=Penicillium steckii TaxID=303698 RepID=A0A1V6TJ96_9EURO|nr:hypothetical protein PENSTE_c005G04893 [Penicillium steckii]
MESFLACFSPRRRYEQKVLKQKEDAARDLEQRPSWNEKDNSLIFQTFEWHMPADRRHWYRLKHLLPEWQSIGIDHIWIPPGCKGMDPNGNGYDIYDLFDLGEFDQKGAISTKWGSYEDLKEMTLEAKSLGMNVIWDAVLNHKAGADYFEKFQAIAVDPKERNKPISDPQEVHGWTGFEFAGRGEKYSNMKYHWKHFTGIDWDQKNEKNDIYKIVGPQKDWAPDVSTENGNYDYLMFADLDHSNPEVCSDLLYWGAWITNLLSISGMRLDAAKHFSTRFQKKFVQHVRDEANSKFFVIGEYWTGNVSDIHDYLEKLDYEALAYDVPLLERFSAISQAKKADLRTLFDGTLVQSRPSHAVTLVANHDTQPGQMLETPVTSSFKLAAYALILLRKDGHPCVFYGDMYGMRTNEGSMIPACDGKLPLLTQARKRYAYGEQEDYFDDPNCIGFVRYGNAHHSGLACLISNGGPSRKRMFIGRHYTNTEWIDILGYHNTSVIIDKRGYGNFPINAACVGVWVNSSAVHRDGLLKSITLDIYGL